MSKHTHRLIAGALMLSTWLPAAAMAADIPAPAPSPLASPAAAPAEDLILQTEEYKRLRAEIRYPGGDRTGPYELILGGIRVGDLQMARAVGDQRLVSRLEQQQFSNRLWSGVISGLTIPAGVYLLLQANHRLDRAGVDRTAGGTSSPDALTFVLGFAGSIAAVYGIINLIPLFNDLAGQGQTTMLGAADAEDLVKRYNDYLRDQIRSGKDRVPVLPGGAPAVNWSVKF